MTLKALLSIVLLKDCYERFNALGWQYIDKCVTQGPKNESGLLKINMRVYINESRDAYTLAQKFKNIDTFTLKTWTVRLHSVFVCDH